jgi:hypothetical protein
MDHRTVAKLEEKLTTAIDEVLSSLGKQRLPMLPTHHTIHLMAKAAVTVYEAAAENRPPPRP